MQLNVRDVAKLLNVSEKTIYRWIRDGHIPAYRFQDQYRFSRTELLEWATARRIGIRPDIIHDTAEESSSPLRLADALTEGGIHYRISGRTREEVLRAAVAAMTFPEGADRETVLSLFMAREELASTAIGDGIAVPHVRSPIVLQVERPLVFLCLLEAPVEFGALDGLPVHALFFLVCPTVRSHLRLLSRLAFCLRDPAFRDAVRRPGVREEILAEMRRVEDSLAETPTP